MKQSLVYLLRSQLILISILLLVGVLFAVGYDYGIPIITVEEGWLLGMVLEPRGLADVEDLVGYPPFFYL